MPTSNEPRGPLNVSGDSRYVTLALFLVGLGTALLGLGWMLGWRTRHWDAHAFSVERRPGEVRLSYGMGLVLQALIAFGFITMAADGVMAVASGRGQYPSWTAAVFTMACIVATTTLAVWAMRVRQTSGKDDIVIDLIDRQLEVPSHASPKGKEQRLDLDGIQRIVTQRVDVSRGNRVTTIEHRVAANLVGTPDPVVVAGMLTEIWARGLAGELGQLLNELNPRVRVIVDLTPVRLKERAY
jgi:hypothetical protein